MLEKRDVKGEPAAKYEPCAHDIGLTRSVTTLCRVILKLSGDTVPQGLS